MNFETFVKRSNQCKNVDELYNLFKQAVAELGFDHSIYSLLTPHLSAGCQPRHGVFHNYPDDWLRHYQAKQYQNIDPVIKHIFRTSHAFSWEEMVKSVGLTHDERRIMREAERASLLSGVGIPLRGANQEVAAIGLATKDENLEISRLLLGIAQAYACQFHAVYMDLMKAKDKACIQLTAREKDVLSWFAVGKTIEEVSNILGIGIETVRSHRKAIYGKLGVNRRTVAVLTAVRNGLIYPCHIEF